MSAGWELAVADNDAMVAPRYVRSDCTGADHCKEIAREFRKTETGYRTDLCFAIKDPEGRLYAHTSDHSGWRLIWKYK